MYYYKDGEKTDLETGDIWNMYKQDKDGDFAGMKKYLPWFEFTVEESEISIGRGKIEIVLAARF